LISSPLSPEPEEGRGVGEGIIEGAGVEVGLGVAGTAVGETCGA